MTKTEDAAAGLELPNIPVPITPTRVPGVKLPLGACDCHAHLFGPRSTYPLQPGSHFRPHVNTLEDYVRMLMTLGVSRAVLVQPSVYGTNNALIESALALQVIPMRAIAVVRPDISEAELLRLDGLGFRGVRINTASATPGLTLGDADQLLGKLRQLGWHLQLFVDFQKTPDIASVIRRLDIPVVIDHLGRVPVDQGVDSAAAAALFETLALPNCWAKLMGPYFVSKNFPDYTDTDALVQRLVEIAPNRLLWGTDWPHPSAHAQMPNDGDLVELLARWVPDHAVRKAILVDNPARLYRF